jgi:hypothetical protein
VINGNVTLTGGTMQLGGASSPGTLTIMLRWRARIKECRRLEAFQQPIALAAANNPPSRYICTKSPVLIPLFLARTAVEESTR